MRNSFDIPFIRGAIFVRRKALLPRQHVPTREPHVEPTFVFQEGPMGSTLPCLPSSRSGTGFGVHGEFLSHLLLPLSVCGLVPSLFDPLASARAGARL